ncbi:MAG: cytochrome oxidase maturation protein, cbb3-type [Paracoccaceae bacterium]|nr:MAG: cbb3-type cytochrome oxidase assembly protein CcoS [Alphaproteobacteria bacterium]GIX13948.1 MAG: cytochrome oxidase maturation protein, cbb3-type [Paracoccaceae bacterium]
MSALAYLIPISVFLGLLGLAAFLWALRSGQFRDIEGDAARILLPDDPEPNLGRSGKSAPEED